MDVLNFWVLLDLLEKSETSFNCQFCQLVRFTWQLQSHAQNRKSLRTPLMKRNINETWERAWERSVRRGIERADWPVPTLPPNSNSALTPTWNNRSFAFCQQLVIVVSGVREEFKREFLEMERDEDLTLPSTSGVANAVVGKSTKFVSPPTRTTTTTIKEGEVVDGANEVTKVYATEEQIRAVFTNGLVSLIL